MLCAKHLHPTLSIIIKSLKKQRPEALPQVFMILPHHDSAPPQAAQAHAFAGAWGLFGKIMAGRIMGTTVRGSLQPRCWDGQGRQVGLTSKAHHSTASLPDQAPISSNRACVLSSDLLAETHHIHTPNSLRL